MIDFLYGYTKDNLRLQGTYFPSENKNICILFIHGMCANAIENYFTTVWGKCFQTNGLGFLYGHTRGYSNVNDIVDKSGNSHTIGTANELFEDCLLDIDL